MKFLTLEYIKMHSRIDYDIEDDLLEVYGAAAEETVLNLCNRSYECIMECYGEVPAPLFQAALMLVDASYTQRTAVSVQNLYVVPYGIDALVKPYMRLT